MKIDGKYLAWAIIHLVLFISMILLDSEIEFDLGFLLFSLLLTLGFGWRFIENMKLAFPISGGERK